MTTAKEISELKSISSSINWFDSPSELIKNKNKFLCYAMKFGLIKDVNYLLLHYSKKEFRAALNSVYAKILDKRTEAYFKLIIKNKDSI